MTAITLESARMIIAAALRHAREHDLKPLGIIVLDEGGHVKAFEREDGASFYRFRVAHGKAHGAVGFGLGSRALNARAERQPYFHAAVGALQDTAVVPVPGGVLIRGDDGTILGAVGISGDVSDADEAAAVAGIKAAGFTPDTGG